MMGKLWNGKLITEIVEICLARRHQQWRWRWQLGFPPTPPSVFQPSCCHFVATVVWLAQWLPQRSTRVAKLLPKLLLELGVGTGVGVTSRKSAYEFAGCWRPLPVTEFRIHSFQFPVSISSCSQGNAARQDNHMWGRVAKVLPQFNNIYWKCIITWKVDTNEQSLLLILMRFAALFEPGRRVLLPVYSACPSLLASRKFLLRKLLQVGESEAGRGGEYNF